MTLPAARLTDLHLCPATTPAPHVGGPITSPGAPTVLIGGQLRGARALDLATCTGPTDIVTKGAAAVLVGGMPAARMTDACLHGGMVAIGFPMVLIGGPVADLSAQAPTVLARGGSTRVYVDPLTKTVYITTNIEYTGPDATQAYADAARRQIEETWSGQMIHNGEAYRVQVQVNTLVNPNGPRTNGYDQVIVDGSTNRMSQTLYGNGPGYQTPAAATDTNRPRRIAHEYGHTLGLDDDYHDTPTGSVPNDPNRHHDIMTQTWADPDGTLPGPDQQHYEQILTNHGY
ncbi:PAAR domain-containing protein [Sorangium sp. So ce269]